MKLLMLIDFFQCVESMTKELNSRNTTRNLPERQFLCCWPTIHHFLLKMF